MVRRTAFGLGLGLAAMTLATAVKAADDALPPIPTLAEVADEPASDLAHDYLLASTAVHLAARAAQGDGTATVALAGRTYRIDADNAATVAPALAARLDVYRKAVADRRGPSVGGQYRLEAGPQCVGEKLDPRAIFATKRVNGEPLTAHQVQLLDAGTDTYMLVSLVQAGQVLGIAVTGVVVDDSIVFADVGGHGFGMFGTVAGNTIDLHLDVAEMKTALGPDAATDADWRSIGECAFTLTRE